MDFQTLSIESVDKIRCTSCKNYLSHFPVTISQDHILCGRCPSSDVTIRNVSFEALAQFIRFPCRYESEGCCEELLPKEIPSHEKNCKYRVIPCPLTESVACVWQRPRINLLEHCLDSHSDLVLKNKGFNLDLTKSENVRNVLDQEGIPLFLDRKFDAEEKKLKFTLFSCVHESKMEYILRYLEITCGEMSLKTEVYLTYEEDYYLTELNLVSIMDNNDDQELKGATGRIIIEEPRKDRTVDVKMLSYLKCTQCSKYATPPTIFSVSNGVLCLNCKPKSGYNYYSTFPETVTKIVAMLNYPCNYAMNGCTYVAKPEEMIKHQSVCKMRNFACPCAEYLSNGCTWNGTLKEITDHMQSKHSSLNLLTNGNRISTFLSEGRKSYGIIKFAKRLFRLSYSCISSESYYFEVQVIGPCSDYFGYEIEILTNSTKKMRLTATKMCGQMTALSQLYENSDCYCFFVKKQMTGFVASNTLNFKVNIFK